MTGIVMACRDGILRAPSGEQFRLVRGRTLADARHPAVVANPDTFMPVEVDLSVEDVDPGYLEDEVAVELAELREKAESAEALAEKCRAALVTISDGLEVRGLIPPGTDTTQEGWLIGALFGALDTMLSADGHTMDGQLAAGGPTAPPSDVPPPRKRAPRVTGG